LSDNNTLFGMAKICREMDGKSEATVLSIKKAYPSFPINKLNSEWIANRDKLHRWLADFAEGDVPELRG